MPVLINNKGEIYMSFFASIEINEILTQNPNILLISYSALGCEEVNACTHLVNIKLKNLIVLGRHCSVPKRLLISFFSILINLKKINSCHFFIIKGHTPLLIVLFVFQKRIKPKIIQLIVGDYLSAKTDAKKFKGKLILNFNKLIDYCSMSIAKSTFFITNNVDLLVRYEQKGIKGNFMLTTTLSKEDIAEFPKPLNIENVLNPIELLFVGRLDFSKGLDLLLESFIHLLEKGYDLNLNLVGSETFNTNSILNIYSSKNNLKGRVNMLGYISDKQKLFNLYKSAYLLVLPSRHEGFPRVVWEAFACGIPVVVSKVGSIEFILKNKSACLFTDLNSIDLANQIESLIVNKELYFKLRHNGFDLVKENTVDKMIHNLLHNLSNHD